MKNLFTFELKLHQFFNINLKYSYKNMLDYFKILSITFEVNFFNNFKIL